MRPSTAFVTAGILLAVSLGACGVLMSTDLRCVGYQSSTVGPVFGSCSSPYQDLAWGILIVGASAAVAVAFVGGLNLGRRLPSDS